jgi:hypothetical protein
MKKPLLLLALLALPMGLLAQENAAAPANAAKLALAREVISASQIDKMFDSMAGQMKQMVGQMAQLPADATPEQREAFTTFQGKAMDLSMGMAKDLVANADLIYAEVYSEAELNAMKAFFLSPEGQSMIAKQPKVMALLMPIMQDIQRKLMPQMKALADEFAADMKTKAAKAAEPPAGK